MHIGLASLPLDHGSSDILDTVHALVRQASNLGVGVLCFSSRSITTSEDPAPLIHDAARLAHDCRLALLLPVLDAASGQESVAVIDASGAIHALYQPGVSHCYPVFELAGRCFGLVLGEALWTQGDCLRPLVRHGAQIVFHSHGTVLDGNGIPPRTWCDPDASFHEKALICRSAEARIPIASVGPAHPRQAAATCVVAPDGSCLCHQPYNQPGLLTHHWESPASDFACLSSSSMP